MRIPRIKPIIGFSPLIALLVLSIGSPTLAQPTVRHERTYLAPIVRSGFSILPTELTAFGGNLYLNGFVPGSGQELLRYDGTAVTVAADIGPSTGSNPQLLFALGDQLFFAADDGVHGQELWRFDGSTAALVEDYIPGPQSPQYSPFGAYHSELYLSGATPGFGREPLRLRNGDISRIADLWPGTPTGLPDRPEYTVFQDRLVFKGENANNFLRLWKYDGATITVTDNPPVHPEGGNASLTIFDGELYFNGDARTGLGNLLYKYDGINESLVAGQGLFTDPASMTALSTELLFTANSNQGRQLWKYDGQTATLLTGNPNPLPPLSGIQQLVAYHDDLYFVARPTPSDAWAIYRYDGISVLPIPEAEGIEYPFELMVHEDSLYFISRDPSLENYGLWKLQAIPVPEPSSSILAIGIGTFLVWMSGRRR